MRVLVLFPLAVLPCPHAAGPADAPLPAALDGVAHRWGWRVDEAAGQPLAYVYGRDDQGASGTGLTTDEARRIATGIAPLRRLLGAGAATAR